MCYCLSLLMSLVYLVFVVVATFCLLVGAGCLLFVGVCCSCCRGGVLLFYVACLSAFFVRSR